MKKISIVVLCFFIFLQTKAQDETEQKLFKKENFFTGGTLNLAFGSQVTNLGLSPFVGYSINKYVDVAASFGFNYVSTRDYPYLGDKVRQKLYGPGAFVRLFPMKFLFAQV